MTSRGPVVLQPVVDSAQLRRMTDARVALGRAGSSLPTAVHLDFVGDHARARDAVWTPVDFESLARELADCGFEWIRVRSQAPDRGTYLRRPDLGRLLDEESITRLLGTAAQPPPEVAVVIADGLSAAAVQQGAVALARSLGDRLRRHGLRLSPLMLAAQARVALGDAVGQALGSAVVVVLVGERPGLSAADSLGAYITWGPLPGTPDSRRNCVSNIRPGGLASEDAAQRIAWLVVEGIRRRLTGVELRLDIAAATELDHRLAGA